jgi:MFS transporter, FHS family, Na+ dependent glucose transporter 1
LRDKPGSLCDNPDPQGRRATTFAYFSAFIGLGLVLASLGPTIPDLATRTDSTLSAFSAVFIAHAMGYLVGALLGGRLFDRFAGHPLLAAMLGLIAICMVLVPLCPSLAILLVVFTVMGISEGSLDAGGNTLLVWLYPTGLGPWMNGLHFFFGVGALLSPLIIAGIVAQGGSVALAYWVLAALLLPPMLWLLQRPSPPIATHHVNAPVDLRPHRTTILLTGGLLFAAVGAEVGFGNWLYTFALHQGLADEAGGRLMTSVFWGAFTVSRLLAIPLATRMTPHTMLLLSLLLVGLAASLPLLFLTTHVQGGSGQIAGIAGNSVAWLWLTTILGGIAVAPIFATALSLAGSRMPISGRATGWFFVGSSTGGMTIPWIMGQLFESVSPTAVFWVILVDVLLGVGIWIAIRMSSKPVAS